MQYLAIVQFMKHGRTEHKVIATPIDNYARWTETIRGSFDPNDKLVNKATLPPTYNANKDRLLYTIRFQNTGTDTAFTVIVRDEIPNNIDVSSLRVVNASHKLIN
jgi:uncharacterized repeat protein (TIGR01451 family)